MKLTPEQQAMRVAYQKAADAQLQSWLEGKPVHHNASMVIEVVDEDGNVVDIRIQEGGECCPDFSCCKPELLAPLEARQRYVAASQAEREGMLMGFLGGMLAGEGVDVHIAGPVEPAPCTQCGEVRELREGWCFPCFKEGSES